MMSKIKQNKRITNELYASLGQYILEYIVYIESGHDAYKALMMIAKTDDDTYVGIVINEAVNMIHNGSSVSRALSHVCGRYYDVNVDSFLRIIMRGFASGEEQMRNSLQQLAGKVMHDEVTHVREQAEKASTKLSFPVALIFIAIVLIAMYPALAQITI